MSYIKVLASCVCSNKKNPLLTTTNFEISVERLCTKVLQMGNDNLEWVICTLPSTRVYMHLSDYSTYSRCLITERRDIKNILLIYRDHCIYNLIIFAEVFKKMDNSLFIFHMEC